MSPPVEGFLIGLILGVILVAYEYHAVKKQVEERAASRHVKPEWEPQYRNRVMTVLRFAILLPFGAAIVYWLWNMQA